jgi:hypothetical protein
MVSMLRVWQRHTREWRDEEAENADRYYSAKRSAYFIDDVSDATQVAPR